VPASFSALICFVESETDCSFSHFCRSAGFCCNKLSRPTKAGSFFSSLTATIGSAARLAVKPMTVS